MEYEKIIQCRCPHCDHVGTVSDFTYVDDLPTLDALIEYRGLGIDVLGTCPNCEKTFCINIAACVEVHAQTYKEVPAHVKEKDLLTIRV